MADFNSLRLKSTEKLTVQEVEIVKDIRRSVPGITEDTTMQKVLPVGAKSRLFKPPNDGGQIRLGGYVARAADTKKLDTFDKLYDGLRLDYTDSRFNGSNSALVIRYNARNPGDYKIPFGGENSKAVHQMTKGDDAVDYIATEQGTPFTGNGFTESKNYIIPEYRNDANTSLQHGTELYEITNQGEKLIGVYSDDYKRFVTIGEWGGIQ